jgi:type VI secretion system secreted protein Hcp
MAGNMFLKLDGVTGESQDDAHKEEIDILSWSWGLSQSGTTHLGSGGGSGKVNVQDISFTKVVDKSSPTLVKFCANGKHMATGKLSINKMGENPMEYLSIELEEIIVSSISTGGSGGEDRLMENVTLNFAKFKETYTPQKDDGSPDVPVYGGWDIAANLDNSA